jgi:acyl dehydratase
MSHEAGAAGIDVHRLPSYVGTEMVSPWRAITEDAVTSFAALSGDEQWIHVDAERARRESPYQSTIAHGFFTLALISRLLRDAVGSIDGARMGVNYGLNKVRFPSPVPVGSQVRGRCTLQHVEAVDGGVQATWLVVVEREGTAKPCCVAEWLVRYLL